MADKKSARIVSKKHLARLERERRQARAIVIAAITIIAIVVGMIGYGILDQTVLQARKPIVRINDYTITVGEFQLRARMQRLSIIGEYMQNYSFALMFGATDPATDSYWGEQLFEIEARLLPNALADQVLEQAIHVVLIRQFAEANGIQVTEEEIDQAIRDAFGYYPDGTPTPAPTSASVVFPTLSATELAMVSPTPSPTVGPTATSQPTPTPDLTATPTVVPTATYTPTLYTQEGFATQYQDALTYYNSETGMTEAEFRRMFFEETLYRSRVFDLVTADVPSTQEQVWARHILVADESTAIVVIMLLNNGVDFATLAGDYSQDQGSAISGGDLGWFSRGMMIEPFEEAAFTLPVGEISEPIQSEFGYHIIQVIAHQDRPLNDSEFQQAKELAFQEWLAAQLEASEVDYSIIVTGNAQEFWALVPDEPSLDAAINAFRMQLEGQVAP
ncbi:MAG: peptidylprolyl isomerase [Anaerolineales bacterium]|nr:peptidylprolyl isomerase [Anaerolineales bacterium]